METTVFGLELFASPRILVLAAATIAVLTIVIAVARRRQSYWWAPLAFVGVSCAGLALSSSLAALMVKRTFAEVTVLGRGIDLVIGMGEATRLPLAATSVGLIAALVAIGLALRADAPAPSGTSRQVRPALFAAVAGLLLAGGIAPALLFRRSIDFVIREITPGTNTLGRGSFAQAITTNLTTTAVIGAGCAVVLAALVVATLVLARQTAPPRRLSFVTAVVLVLSLGVYATLAARLVSSPAYRSAERAEAAEKG